MDKLEMQSKNLVDDNIGKIEKLFPNCITEGQDENGKLTKLVDFDLLKQELSKDIVEGNDERYTLNWAGKKQAILTANSPINATLRPCREESVDFDSTKNLYIEGDNLDVLKLLRETYLNKVKMIYIDPPYNTGNDFVYEDDFASSTEDYLQASKSYDEQGNRMFQNNESNGRFHSDWLSMMYSRLKLAKDLLSEDGVIFISIDDNEVDNLLKIGHEIFGENNFIGIWSWFKSQTPPNLSYKLKKNIEYVIAFEKNRDNIKYSGLKRISPSNDPITKPQNTYKILEFPPHTIKTKMSDQTIKKGIYGTDKFPNELIEDLVIKDGYNENKAIFKNRFIWTQDTLLNTIKKGVDIFMSDKIVLSYKRKNYDNEVPPNFISVDIGSTTEEGGKYLENLMGAKIFDYPKTNQLLKYLLKFKDDKNSIILDFFSGSATTAHAVMQLNAEDGGNRKFIMVQLPEICDEKSEAYKAGYKNICEIGKERIRRAGLKIKEDLRNWNKKSNKESEGVSEINGIPFSKSVSYIDEEGISQKDKISLTNKADYYKFYPDNLDIGFRDLKLDSSCMKDVYYDPTSIKQDMLSQFEDNIKEDRTPEDLLFQVMLDMGVILSSEIKIINIQGKKVFNVNDGNLVCCFDKNLTDELVTEIAKLQPLYAVFRDSSMSSDSVAVNFDQIFETYSPTTTRKVI